MRRKLLEILRCPACRSELNLHPERTEGAEIVEGDLECRGCARRYPIVNRVPRMILNAAPVEKTRSSFRTQWKSRFAGKAERRTMVFAQDVLDTALWIHQSAQGALLASGPGSWCLDAGCGSGEKTVEFAKCVPSHNVVGLDLSDTLEASYGENCHISNLHFVQADMFHPPFAEETFAFGMSFAAMHHTSDTSRAFRAIAATVKRRGTFLSWLYPLAEEYPNHAYGALYRQRDWHMLNIPRHLPPWLCMLCCKVYVALLFPILIPTIKRISNFGSLSKRNNLTLREQYHSAVFYTHDNVAPYYQYRHSVAEVAGWYKECGYGHVNTDHPGLYIAHRL
ncbi:MAG: methyltransferase domain-containing protein [Pseudomonadota bacterium]